MDSQLRTKIFNSALIRVEVETTIALKQFENYKPKIIYEIDRFQIEEKYDPDEVIKMFLDNARMHLRDEVGLIHKKMEVKNGKST